MTTKKAVSKKLRSNQFRCDNCGGVFDKGWSDEEAREEAKQWTEEEMVGGESVVCDDCYIEFMAFIKKNGKSQLPTSKTK